MILEENKIYTGKAVPDGVVTLKNKTMAGYKESVVAIVDGAVNTIDASNYNYAAGEVSSATTINLNMLAGAGASLGLTIEIDMTTVAAITWDTDIVWVNGIAPDMSVIGKYIFVFTQVGTATDITGVYVGRRATNI